MSLSTAPRPPKPQTQMVIPSDEQRVADISRVIPGWSDMKQYAFFKALLTDNPQIRDVLILGVYQGRDIAFLLDVAARYFPHREIDIVGVDKFSAEPCDDWPEEKRGMTWEQAGFGPAPDFDRAVKNIAPFRATNRAAFLVREDDAKFLAETKLLFDFAYLDTAHDAATVKRQCEQVARVTRDNAIIAGDDYSNQGTWGVAHAVSEMFNTHVIFAWWIWYSNRKELKGVTV
jgi:hypothetical protein